MTVLIFVVPKFDPADEVVIEDQPPEGSGGGEHSQA